MSVMTQEKLQCLLEAAMMAYGKPMSIEKLESLFEDDKRPTKQEIRDALNAVAAACEQRGVELKEVASGFRFQAKQEYAEWISRLWEEKPPRYSRALLETLALIAYRQPITRSEIEDVRGVSVSSHIIKTLLEREWIRVVGHRDVPGRPALYATTKEFLDYFNLKSLGELPTLSDIRDLDQINAELALDDKEANHSTAEGANNETTHEATVEQPLNDGESQVANETSHQLADSDELVSSKASDVPVAQHHDDRSLAEQVQDAQLSDAELLEEAELARSNMGRSEDNVFNDAYEPGSFESRSESDDEPHKNDSASGSQKVAEDEALIEHNKSHTRSSQDA